MVAEVIQTLAAIVDPGMSVISRPNHPLRLAWLFGATLAVAGIIAAAAGALLFMVEDQRGGNASRSVVGGAAIDAPDGLIVVIPVDTAKEFRDLGGFKPFLPRNVPRNTDPSPKFAVSQPDAAGERTGRVAFSAKPDAAIEGITGPIVVLAEAPYAPAADAELGQLKRIDDGKTRAIVATIGCGDMTIDMQLFFGPDAAPGEEIITPYMRTVASQFLAELQGQCS